MNESSLFLIDEYLSPFLTNKFKELGYQAKTVKEAGLKGREDPEIINWAKKRNFKRPRNNKFISHIYRLTLSN